MFFTGEEEKVRLKRYGKSSSECKCKTAKYRIGKREELKRSN